MRALVKLEPERVMVRSLLRERRPRLAVLILRRMRSPNSSSRSLVELCSPLPETELLRPPLVRSGDVAELCESGCASGSCAHGALVTTCTPSICLAISLPTDRHAGFCGEQKSQTWSSLHESCRVRISPGSTRSVGRLFREDEGGAAPLETTPPYSGDAFSTR